MRDENLAFMIFVPFVMEELPWFFWKYHSKKDLPYLFHTSIKRNQSFIYLSF